jgi:iron complex outermembrane recepter protein
MGAFVLYSRDESRFGGFAVGGGVRYIGETWADAANTQRNDPITTFDFVAYKDLGKFRLQLNVNNILNRQVAICNTGNCTWSIGRLIYGAVSVRW